MVAWVNARDRPSLLAGFAAIADACGLSGGVRMPVHDAALAVRRRLEADGDGCLVVFDNVSDPDVLRPFVPAAGAARVLITSDRQPAAGLGTSVPVGVFSPDQALTFLVSRTGLADTAGAAALAAELEYLPLALAQAAAVISALDLDCRTYLERLRALSVQEHLTRRQGQPYPPGVPGSVLLNLDAVRTGDEGGVCARVMEIMAVLSAAGVRRELLHAAGKAGETADGSAAGMAADALDRALTLLAEQSLLSFSESGQTIIPHQFVMRIVRDTLTRSGRLAAICRVAAAMLEAYADTLNKSQDRQALRDIPGQVAALMDSGAISAGEADEELARVLLSLRLAALRHLNELGDSAAQAIAVGEPLTADFDRVLGPRQRNTLASQDNLAQAYQSAGRTVAAIALFEHTLGARERELGANHPETLQSRENLAGAYLEASRTADAIALFEQVLAARERRLGPGHPRTLTSRNDLAEAYVEASRTAEAIALFEQVLVARDRVLGPDHPHTLESRDNLAAAYRDVGQTAAAIALFHRTLAARERVLGPDHPRTLESRDNLALACWSAGQIARTIPLFERTLAARERVLGPDHPVTLISRHNLATAYWAAGRTDQAIPLHEQVLAARERVLGPDHLATLTSRNNLAAAYSDVGRTGQAIALFEQVLGARERVLGPDHPATSTTRNNLAMACSRRSKWSRRSAG
jgi:tetratricopeptide (TPR) repeat protein